MLRKSSRDLIALNQAQLRIADKVGYDKSCFLQTEGSIPFLETRAECRNKSATFVQFPEKCYTIRKGKVVAVEIPLYTKAENKPRFIPEPLKPVKESLDQKFCTSLNSVALTCSSLNNIFGF